MGWEVVHLDVGPDVDAECTVSNGGNQWRYVVLHKECRHETKNHEEVKLYSAGMYGRACWTSPMEQ